MRVVDFVATVADQTRGQWREIPRVFEEDRIWLIRVTGRCHSVVTDIDNVVSNVTRHGVSHHWHKGMILYASM